MHHVSPNSKLTWRLRPKRQLRPSSSRSLGQRSLQILSPRYTHGLQLKSSSARVKVPLSVVSGTLFSWDGRVQEVIASIVECVALAWVTSSCVACLSVSALENAHRLGLAVHWLQHILLRDLLGLLLILLSSSDGELLLQVGVQRVKSLRLLCEGTTAEQQLILLVHRSREQTRILYLKLLHELLMA